MTREEDQYQEPDFSNDVLVKMVTVIALGNCGLYTGPWGVRVEDTVVVKPEGPQILTDFIRKLEL
jgi:Xaa-Pro aminopeptidase